MKEFKEYRDNLAETIKAEPDHSKRHEILEKAQQTRQYEVHREDHQQTEKSKKFYENNKEAFEKEYEIAPDYFRTANELSSGKENYKTASKFMSMEFDDLQEKGKFIAKPFFFSGINKREDIRKELEKQGFRSARLKEVLAFIENNPEFKKIHLVSIGSLHHFGSGESYQPIVQEDKEGKLSIGYGCFWDDCIKEKATRNFFLGIKKEKEGEKDDVEDISSVLRIKNS